MAAARSFLAAAHPPFPSSQAASSARIRGSPPSSVLVELPPALPALALLRGHGPQLASVLSHYTAAAGLACAAGERGGPHGQRSAAAGYRTLKKKWELGEHRHTSSVCQSRQLYTMPNGDLCAVLDCGKNRPHLVRLRLLALAFPTIVRVLELTPASFLPSARLSI